MSRINYTAKTVAAAAHLLKTCEHPTMVDGIMARTTQMLNSVWGVEYRNIKAKTPVGEMPYAVAYFWDRVSTELSGVEGSHIVLQAVHGQEVNPPGHEGNVHISFQANNSATRFVAKLRLPS